MRRGKGGFFVMKKGALIGYLNIDGETEWGLVTSDAPFIYSPNEYDKDYMAVTVVWPQDKLSTTNERISMILSNDETDSGLWLQSSL